MKPLVSVLIPAYNASAWIADTIRSALSQTWENIEIIIVDDGSRDETLAVTKRFASNRVSVVTQQNGGAAAARNRAFSLSQGEYIQWLDADDLLSPDKIEKQVRAAAEARNNRLLLSCGWGHFIYRPSKARFVSGPLWHDLPPLEWLLRKWEHNAHMQTATWLVSRELSEEAGPFDTRLLGDDDGEYFFRVIMHSDGIRFVPDAKVFYRVSPSSRLSHIGRSNKKMEAQFLGMKMQIEYLRALEDSQRVRAACVMYLQTWLRNFYPNRPDLVQEAQELAATLEGRLSLPKASWKYAWVEKLFGFGAAKHAQLSYNRAKSWTFRAWDRMMYLFERSRLPS